MKQAGGDDEATTIGQGICRGGELGAMRMAVEDGEHRNDRRGQHERGPDAQSDRQSEHQRRECDHQLGNGQPDLEDAHHGAERHHQRKDDRQHPDRGAAELRTPDADGDHRNEMVQPGQRMQQSGGQPATDAGLLVGKTRARRQHGQQHHAASGVQEVTPHHLCSIRVMPAPAPAPDGPGTRTSIRSRSHRREAPRPSSAAPRQAGDAPRSAPAPAGRTGSGRFPRRR